MRHIDKGDKMANTYTQIYLQIIFAVKGRQSLLPKSNNDELQKYITGIIKNNGQKLLAINNMPDHIHIFIGFGTTITISDLLRDIKANSSRFINEKRWFPGRFEWQKGYGAFSYSRSQLDNVVKYVMNQQQHHKRRTFREEYIDFLQKFEVEYNPKYLFEFYDD